MYALLLFVSHTFFVAGHSRGYSFACTRDTTLASAKPGSIKSYAPSVCASHKVCHTAEKGDHEALEMLCALAYEKDAAKFSMAYKEILQHSEDHFDWNKDADDDYSEDGEDKLLYGRFMRNTNNIQILKTLENADTANMSETEKKTIRECIDLLNRERSVITYNNKVALFTRLNNVVECGICYDDKLNIDLHCGHCVCTDCYPRIVHNSCPFCRIESPCGFFD